MLKKKQVVPIQHPEKLEDAAFVPLKGFGPSQDNLEGLCSVGGTGGRCANWTDAK